MTQYLIGLEVIFSLPCGEPITEFVLYLFIVLLLRKYEKETEEVPHPETDGTGLIIKSVCGKDHKLVQLMLG